MGPFGLGWTDNWQISASADSNGNVTISDDGSLLYFAKKSDGSYLDAPGEYGTLTLVSGAYQYVQTDGTIIAFNTNGTLNYEQDTNGNRITAGYNSQRRADEPDRLERLGDHDSLQRARASSARSPTRRPVDHLHLRRQRPAPADVHRRVRQDDVHLRHRTDRGRCERPDFDHLRRRHGHRIVLRRRRAALPPTGRLKAARPRPRPTPIPRRANTPSPTPTATRRPSSTTTRATWARRSTRWATSRDTPMIPMTT